MRYKIIDKKEIKSGMAIIFKDCQGVLLNNKILICNPDDNTSFKQIPYTLDQFNERYELEGNSDYNIMGIYTEENICLFDRDDLEEADFFNSILTSVKQKCIYDKEKCNKDNCKECIIEIAIKKCKSKYCK